MLVLLIYIHVFFPAVFPRRYCTGHKDVSNSISPLDELALKVQRMDAIDQIRQLAAKYALAVDMRDLDAVVGLYVEDVRVSKTESGRQALKRSFANVLRSFTASAHHIGGHIIEFDDAETAHGLAYCRCEHEVGDRWVPMYLYYLDAYRNIDGRWFFKRRVPCELYATSLGENPTGAHKIRWPGKPPRDGTWHAHFPSWTEFWADPARDVAPVPPPAELEKFIDTMRRGTRQVIPPDFSWVEPKVD
jgi:ketosteroid isomerase-like protein